MILTCPEPYKIELSSSFDDSLIFIAFEERKHFLKHLQLTELVSVVDSSTTEKLSGTSPEIGVDSDVDQDFERMR